MFYVMFELGMTYVWFGRACNVFTTCNGRDQDERAGHMLGVEFICQIKQGGTLGEYYGTKREVMEWYVQAQDARS